MSIGVCNHRRSQSSSVVIEYAMSQFLLNAISNYTRAAGRWCSRLVTAGAAVAFLGGCAVTESTLIDASSPRACDSDAGSYYLSKTVFEVLVTSDVDTNKNLDPKKHRPTLDGTGSAAKPTPETAYKTTEPLASDKMLISVNSRVVADRSRGYCLDFLASPTAEEAIHVDRDNNGVLAKITTDSKDRSADILKNIIKTVLIAGASDDMDGSRFRADETDLKPRLGQVFKAAYDPLNLDQANLINQTLRQHGFCLVIEDQSFDHHVHSIQDYCDNPLGHHSREKALDKSAGYVGDGPMVQHVRGVLYRPRVAYNYYLFVKRGNAWKLRKSVTVNLENRAPVLALQIDRAFFTNRKTAMTFDQGALLNVRVEKGSELAGFVEVPLTLAQGIAALPANIVKVKIDVTNQRSTLIKAQDDLLKAQRDYNADVLRLQAAQGAPPGTPRNDSAYVPAGGVIAFPQKTATHTAPAAEPPPPPIAGMRSDPGTRTETGARSTAAPPPDARCQAPCLQRGFSAPSCQRYCGCYSQCQVASGTPSAQQQSSTCVRYCEGFLP